MTCFNDAKKRNEALKENGIYSLFEKINSANDLVKKSLENSDNPRIAFSGGKDSLVVLDIVRKVDNNIIGVFCNTGNEYKETPTYVRTFDNIIELHPEKSFWQCVKEYGLPMSKSKAKRHGNYCCLWLKEKPAM